MSYRVLIAEDDPTTRYLIGQYCKEEPYVLAFADDGIEAMRTLKEEQVDIVVTDVRLPGISGETLLTFAHETYPHVPVIVITGYGSIDGAVRFLQHGAFDYIAKPFTGSVFSHRLSLAARHLELTHEIVRLRALGPVPALRQIKSTDPAIALLLSRLPSIAKTDASVVFQGESGTGKELFSRAVHELSPRARGQFVSVSCAALPETLIESELFGHVRGAFTDAHADRAGLIEEAEKGTLFLDEIGELPLAVQAKLLRFLQEREFKAVGSNLIRHADVRIVAATHRDLPAEVRAGAFREDLFYRLNVVPLTLPPLRQRVGDIPLLANHFLEKFAVELKRPVSNFAPEVLETMSLEPWPGNVRQLMNRVQRTVVMADEPVIGPDAWRRSETELPKVPAPNVSGGGFMAEKRQLLARFERDYLSACLRAADGNVARAARSAKMDRKNFWTLMKRHELDPQAFRPAEAAGTRWTATPRRSNLRARG